MPRVDGLIGQNHDAFVVFSDETRVWWLRGLRRGFRHCLVLLRHGDGWLSLDPTLVRIVLMTHPETPEKSFIDLLKDHGFVVVPARINDDLILRSIPGVLTCVTVVKRILGLRAGWVFTPWQLFKYLRNQQIKACEERK